MRTFVYVDGFNLYYRALKKTPYKWLNLHLLATNLLKPYHEVVAVKYFTARVTARPNNPQQPMRQNIYLRALQTLPSIEIVYGTFLSNIVRARLAYPGVDGPTTAEIIKTEEKGSDVNLAAHLVHDAHGGRFDAAIVITSDSDLCEPIRIVNKELGLHVGVFYPSKHQSQELLKVATFVRPIRPGVLANSQFPAQMRDEHGEFRKPPAW